MHNVFETRCRKIDYLITTQFLKQFPIPGAINAIDVQFFPPGKLDGESPHATCCTVDKHALSSRQMSVIKESLPSCQRNKRNCRCLPMIQGKRSWRQLRG